MAATLPQSEHMAWHPNGTMFMGKEHKLYKWTLNKDDQWILMADLSHYNLNGITRIAVSPLGDKLAVVVAQ